MADEKTSILQSVLDETFVLVKKTEEQQQKFSINYQMQLDSIKSQGTTLKTTVAAQHDINDSLKRQTDRLGFIVKVGFGGIIIGVIALLSAAGMWWHAHQEFKREAAYEKYLVSVKESIPTLASKDGSPYIRIVKDSQENGFIDSHGNYVNGYYAKIYQGDDS